MAAAAYQQAHLDPRVLTPTGLLALQRVVGSAAVDRILAQAQAQPDEQTQSQDRQAIHTTTIQREVIFYWHPEHRWWAVYEDDKEPIGQYRYGDQYHPFDWQRWQQDNAYFMWFQNELGIPEGAEPAVAPQQPAPAPQQIAQAPQQLAPAQQQIQYTGAQVDANGYREIRAMLGNQVIGTVRFGSQETAIPGGNGRTGVELSQVQVDQAHRGGGIGFQLLDRALRAIGLNRTVWLDAVSQGGLSQAQLVAWYGRYGFEATGHGNIMVTVDIQ